MKRLIISSHRTKPNKLSLRTETVRFLTERELTLVAAGNCVNGSGQSQLDTNLIGIC